MSKMWERADFWPAERVGLPVDDDFARGVAEGRRTVEAELAGEREAMLQLAGSLESLQAPSPSVLTELIVSAVERLVTDIVGNAPIDAALLNERAAALAATIATEAEAILAVNPDDLPLLDDERLPFQLVGDHALARGMVEARLGNGTIEDGVRTALGRLRAEIAALGIIL